MAQSPARPRGDIQTAVVRLVDRLAPMVAVVLQPAVARRIAGVIADRPNTIRDAMALRQGIIRRGVATGDQGTGDQVTGDQVAGGIAAWVTLLFDLANLQQDRSRALDVPLACPDDALPRLARARAGSPGGCILAVPHIGSVELFIAALTDRGFDVGFLHTIGREPTPTERWIHAGRQATHGTPIAFGRRSTGAEIAGILARRGVVFMVADVYPSARYRGIDVRLHGGTFSLPPGPARFARAGTPVLPGFVSHRTAGGLSMQILDPLDPAAPTPEDAACALTQQLATHFGQFIAERPEAFWLWHPIPNDPFLALARRHRPDLLTPAPPTPADDEATARAVDALALDALATDALAVDALATDAPAAAPASAAVTAPAR